MKNERDWLSGVIHYTYLMLLLDNAPQNGLK